MNPIVSYIDKEKEFSDVKQALDTQLASAHHKPLLVSGLCDGARTAFIAALAQAQKKYADTPLLAVMSEEKDCMQMLNFCVQSGMKAAFYPCRDFVFYNVTSSHDAEQQRIAALSAVVSNSIDILFTVADAAVQYTIPKSVLSSSSQQLVAGEDYSLSKLCELLVSGGYSRVDMVSGAGQFSHRGSIIDIFPPDAEHPIRCDFFGDTLDRLCIFDIMSQRNIENIDCAEILPVREVLVNEEKREAIKDVIQAQIKRTQHEHIKDALKSELEACRSGNEILTADKYINTVYSERTTLLDYFPSNSTVIICDRNAVSERLEAFEWQNGQNISTMLDDSALPARLAEYAIQAKDFEMICENKLCMYLETFTASFSGKKLGGLFNFQSRQTVSYFDNFALLTEDLHHYTESSYSVTILCENELSAKNMQKLLFDENIPTSIKNFDNCDKVSDGEIVILYGISFAGYELPIAKTAILSLFPSTATSLRMAKSAKRRNRISRQSSQERIMSYADLEIGDYIVHANHGIGQYLGLEQLVSNGVTRDYIKIKYAGNDMLYIPTDQFEMVSKYIGSTNEDGSVKLTNISSSDWSKQKSRAKAATKEIAKELIALYAARMRRSGFAFPVDDEIQREFEDAFAYDETDGQIAAINDIKHDMQSDVPMDRLLCGDVGFGKTEVALRAAFKAVLASKQVAILVPTTILALQHYQTILSRFRSFPVKVDMISRFRTQKQREQSLRSLKRGETDIIVGTHALLGKKIEFHDMGLLIIDEEQRFGVTAKERLKTISENVDVLTLTATPIPRTLNMAMGGIRDMSILEQAPSDRYPVQTYVLEYDDAIISEAIRRELRRGGQVFYMHNNVETIDAVAVKVQKMAGDDKTVAVAHGQMDKERISDIWKAMLEGGIDVLVCTTIIETGVDVPNANTLIIENSDKLGLSQLHQIRGRVGRSSRQAYAYFTYRKGKAVSEIAQKRLTALRDYTEFGSGFKIALRDLEIRGAGNLLGVQQHGHIDSVGYDLYMKLLNDAVLEEKGEKKEERAECAVEIPVSAFIPDTYITAPAQRIDAYKKIAYIQNDADLFDIRDELTDRYGDVPDVTENLFNVSLLRAKGGQALFTRIVQSGSSVQIYPQKLVMEKWNVIAAQYRGQLLLNAGQTPYISIRTKKGESILSFALEIVNIYLKLTVNQ